MNSFFFIYKILIDFFYTKLYNFLGGDFIESFNYHKTKKENKYFTYTDLAKYIGITKQCLSRHLKVLEKGRNPFSASQMKKICEFLNEDISIFFN